MTVTDAVIRDLYALVQAGEASADTQALVAASLAANPALAEELRRTEAWTLPAAVPGRAIDAERVALRRTKALLARRSWSMGLGFFFTGLPLSFVWDSHGFHFLLIPSHAALAALCLALGIAAWVVFVRASRALRPTGF